MQLGRAGLTPERRWERQMEGRCFYCGEISHLVFSCPAKGSQAVSYVLTVSPMPHTLTRITVIHHTATDLEALIDSGEDESLMDWGLARKLGLKPEPLAKPIRARSLNGKDLIIITHINEPVQMIIDCQQEHIRPCLFTSLSHSLILGHPWLCHHNPRVDWKTGKIREWGKECTKNCVFSANWGGNVKEINLFFCQSCNRFRISRPELCSLLWSPPSASFQQDKGHVTSSSLIIRRCQRSAPQCHYSQGAPVLRLWPREGRRERLHLGITRSGLDSSIITSSRCGVFLG